jgi:DNA-binding NarL/FixJ family response regulator
VRSSGAPVKVLVADDHRLFRTGLTRMLSADPRFEVVGEAKDGVEAIGQTIARKPDVVLMDLQMPRVNGVEAVKSLKREAPDVRVVLVSAYADGRMIEEAMASGASAYVNKDVTMDEVATRIIEASTARASRLKARQAVLSSREVLVLRQVASGLSNKQIAIRLGISEKTVRNHLSRIFQRLRAANRTDAVITAMRLGIRVF